MHQHPVVQEAIVRGRVDGLRHNAGARARVRRETRRLKLLAAARHGAGWLLVDLGLRLAMPRAGVKQSIASGRR
jgi:hypothetical protein